MEKLKISAVVAMSDNNCIGKDNDLPWYIPEDLKRFKELTMGKPVIMGRKTFESIVARLEKPLPGRDNIIISRNSYEAEGAIVCSDIEGAIEKAKELAAEKNLDEIIIGGGAQIYNLALPYMNRIHLTRVHTIVNGDAFFPEPDNSWHETERNDFPAAANDQPAYSFITLEKVKKVACER